MTVHCVRTKTSQEMMIHFNIIPTTTQKNHYYFEKIGLLSGLKVEIRGSNCQRSAQSSESPSRLEQTLLARVLSSTQITPPGCRRPENLKDLRTFDLNFGACRA